MDYCHIFNYEFNIVFFKPKKDLCDFCEKYKNSSPSEQGILNDQYDLHMLNKGLSREQKEHDKKKSQDDPTLSVFIFDLQKVLPVPCGDVSLFYYKRKLATYNFTVYDMANKNGVCYMWYETLGSRGANEIGTCVYKHIAELPNTTKNVVFTLITVGVRTATTSWQQHY